MVAVVLESSPSPNSLGQRNAGFRAVRVVGAVGVVRGPLIRPPDPRCAERSDFEVENRHLLDERKSKSLEPFMLGVGQVGV